MWSTVVMVFSMVATMEFIMVVVAVTVASTILAEATWVLLGGAVAVLVGLWEWDTWPEFEFSLCKSEFYSLSHNV